MGSTVPRQARHGPGKRVGGTLLIISWLACVGLLSSPAPQSAVGADLGRTLLTPKLWVILLVGTAAVAWVGGLGRRWAVALFALTAAVYVLSTLTCPVLVP